MCFHPYHTQIINPHKTKALSNYQPACDWLHKSDEVDAARSYQRHRKEFEVLACSTLKAEFQACVLWGSEKGKEGSCVACSQMTCWQTSSTSNESIALVCQQLPPITPYPQKTWMCFLLFFFFPTERRLISWRGQQREFRFPLCRYYYQGRRSSKNVKLKE